jgi:hypothetical protein
LKKYLYSLATILFIGCSQPPIYKEIKENNISFSCLNVTSIYESDLQIVAQHFKVSESCNYDLLVEPHLVHNCNNPRVKSLGSDFDGYVAIKLLKDEKLLFRSQTDFKGDDYLPSLERLLYDLKDFENVLK